MSEASLPTEPTSPGYMQPIVIDRGGLAELDSDFKTPLSNSPEIATILNIGKGYPEVGTGTLVVEYWNGIVDVWRGLTTGAMIAGKFKKVLTSGEVNGVTFTTDTEDMTWKGGQ